MDVRHERAPEAGKDRIELTLSLGGDLSDEQAARIRAVSRQCPVHRMLAGGVELGEH